MTSPCTSDPTLDKLIAKALRLIRGRTAREQALAEVFKNYRAQHCKQPQASRFHATGEAPQQVVDALRSPVGVDRVAIVRYEGMLIKAVLHPHGKPDLQREAAVWQCMRAQAVKERGDPN